MQIKIDVTKEQLGEALGLSDDKCSDLGMASAKFVETVIHTKEFNDSLLVANAVENAKTIEEALFAVYCLGILHKELNMAHTLGLSFRCATTEEVEDMKFKTN